MDQCLPQTTRGVLRVNGPSLVQPAGLYPDAAEICVERTRGAHPHYPKTARMIAPQWPPRSRLSMCGMRDEHGGRHAAASGATTSSTAATWKRRVRTLSTRRSASRSTRAGRA